MKIQFDPGLDYQLEAVNSVVDIFQGQEICQTSFTVVSLAADKQEGLELPGLEQKKLGVGNKLRLLSEEILDNVKKIQALRRLMWNSLSFASRTRPVLNSNLQRV